MMMDFNLQKASALMEMQVWQNEPGNTIYCTGIVKVCTDCVKK